MDPFDNAIAATGAATIAWMAAHNLHPKGQNETAVHTAIACTDCTATPGELAFIEAIPDAGVIITPATTFFHREPPSTAFYKGVVAIPPAASALRVPHEGHEGSKTQHGGSSRSNTAGGADVGKAAQAAASVLQPTQVYAAAVRAARSVVGSSYASEFEPPSAGKYYCSSLVEWAFARALAEAGQPSSMNSLFTQNVTFRMLFVPMQFWKKYYASVNLSVPVNATGSNPTLLLHSPAVTFSPVAAPPSPAAAAAAPPAPPVKQLRSESNTSVAVSPPPVLWANGYPFSPSESHPHGGVETADGGFLVVGDGVDYTLPPTSAIKRRIYVLRIDKDGKILWQQRVGDLDYNYGKFGIELRDGRILVSGAISEMDAELQVPVLKRALVLFSAKGELLLQLTLPNAGKHTLKRDGFMCVSQGPGQEIVATGFVGGDNYTSGYVDEPMFLIGGGKVAVNTFNLADGGGGSSAWTTFSNLNNVYGKVPVPKQSTDAVKYLGTFATADACFGSCNATQGCEDWTFHSPSFPDANFAGGCYYTVGGEWSPTADPLVTSARNTYQNSLSVVGDAVLDDSGKPYQAMQGMRLFYDQATQGYVVSHTVSATDGGSFQFGMSFIKVSSSSSFSEMSADASRARASTTPRATAAVTLVWMNAYWATLPIPTPTGPGGHASHPYALTIGQDGSYVIGGLAVIYGAKQIEQCQGRMVAVDPKSGAMIFDRRFTSALPDTNIECYGIQTTLDGGYIMTCGTGVEPELHPNDPPKSKTWRALVHRTDGQGRQLWQKDYTSNADLKSNAGEYIVATKDGGYAIYIDSKGEYGPGATGGNFAVMRLAKDF